MTRAGGDRKITEDLIGFVEGLDCCGFVTFLVKLA